MVKYSTLTPGAAATIAAFKDVTLLAPAPVLVPTPADSFPVVVLESLVDVGGAPLMVVSGPGPSEGEEAVAGEALKSELELVTVAGEAFMPELEELTAPEDGTPLSVRVGTPEPAQRLLYVEKILWPAEMMPESGRAFMLQSIQY